MKVLTAEDRAPPGVLGEDVAGEQWIAADRMTMWEKARVIGVERSRSGTVLRLRLGEMPIFQAGQYYLVRVKTAGLPRAVEQAYSLSSSPCPPSAEVEIAVREVPGGRVSPVLTRHVWLGDLLQVRGPFGFLTWTERDRGPVGLIGAGSGVAPLTSIVRYAASRGRQVPMTLLRSSRDRSTALLGDELEALDRGSTWFDVVSTVTRDSHDPLARFHRRIDVDMLAEVFGASGGARRPSIYYVAGPGEMVISVRAMLGSLGVADDAIYSEDHT